MRWQIDLLSRLSDLSPLSSCFHSFFLFILAASSSGSNLLLGTCREPELEDFALPQTKVHLCVDQSRAGVNRREILAAVCLVYTFSFSVRARLSLSFPFCFPPHLRVSVWLMVWNIERCLFLLWLGRQGALRQTTRDQIDYAASSVKSALMWLLSALYIVVRRGKSPLA